MVDLPWEGAAKLLSAGPLGLGAILVLVTGWILSQKHTIEKGRLKVTLAMLGSGVLLTLAGFAILYLQISTGYRTAEFAAQTAAINAQHMVHFQVYPNDLGHTQTMPPPIIKINNEELGKPPNYLVKSEITVIVDVSDAINQAQEYKTANGQQAEALKIQSSALESAAENSKKIPSLLVSSCLGENRNSDPINTNEIVLLNSSTVRALEDAKLNTKKVLDLFGKPSSLNVNVR
jgi:hypothetical protein